MKIEISPAAKKYIKRLKDIQLKRLFKDVFKEIQLNPYEAGDLKSGDLAGIYCRDFKYQGITYEVAYIMTEDQDGTLLLIILAGTRENFYHELKRYMKISSRTKRSI